MVAAEEHECLTEAEIAALVDGALDAEGLARAEGHLAECASCRGVVADAAHGAMPTAATDAPPSSASPRFRLPAVGETIAGKYVVEEHLGRGGMGAVIGARHVTLGHHVAIKVLFYGSGPNVARFFREAQTCARLKSEHIARVFDVGELEGGTPYLVMEHLSGSDLAGVIARGPVSVADAAGWVLQACAGLAEAHAAGIVHRDLKPANLFLTTRADGTPLVKVLDFGISKLLKRDGVDDVSLTATRALVGSPLYMSPEQVQDSKDVDLRTDIWSLGVILYQLLTRALPFRKSALTALSVEIVTAEPRPPSSLRPDVPAEIEACVLRCLEKNRDDRFASVHELAAALSPFAPVATMSAFSAGSVPPRARRPRTAVVAAFVAGVAIAAATSVAVVSRGGGARAESTATTAPAAPASTIPAAAATTTTSATTTSATTDAPAAFVASAAPSTSSSSAPAARPSRPAPSARPTAAASSARRPPPAPGPTDTPD